jgi:radical SAM protein with 4Fe4S-binding SPASM domain
MASGFRDKKNLLRKFTARKLINAAQIYGSFQWSRAMARPVMQGLPISLAIEPTTSCNLRCPECPSGLRSFTRPTGMLGETMFRALIDELHHALSYLTFYFQGEPFLHPRFLDMVSYAAQRNIYTSTSTNAHYLGDTAARATVESGLDRLIISVDGTTQETYQQYRIGGSLAKVLEGTQNILRWRKALRASSPQVVLQFLVVRHNEHQVKDLYRLADELGADHVVLKTAQIYDFKNGSPLIPNDSRYSRYAENPDGTYSIRNSLDDNCWRMWHSSVMTWDGKIVPCCFDKDASHVMGDIASHSFREIWTGDRYNAFRAELLKSRSSIDICTNCTEGSKVWA